MKPVITWILIADGARARVLEHAGPGKGLSEVNGLEFSQERLQGKDIWADKPGRSFNSVGAGRAAMEPPTDPVDKREADFVGMLADVLDRKNRDGAFDRLIIAAAPQALGDLRKAMSPQLQAKIETEIAKDLTRIPNDDVVKHFSGVLAV